MEVVVLRARLLPGIDKFPIPRELLHPLEAEHLVLVLQVFLGLLDGKFPALDDGQEFVQSYRPVHLDKFELHLAFGLVCTFLLQGECLWAFGVDEDGTPEIGSASR